MQSRGEETDQRGVGAVKRDLTEGDTDLIEITLTTLFAWVPSFVLGSKIMN